MKANLQHKQRVIQIVFIVASVLLLFKAFQLQLLDTTFHERAQATAVNKHVLYPSRGLIYDRNQKLLVNNNAMYDLMVTYNQIDKNMDTLRFCKLLNITRETFEKNLNKDFRRNNRFSVRKPFVFLKKISAENYASFQESLHEFPGFFVQVRNVRGYPRKNAAHVLGYLSEVNQNQINASEKIYARGDYIGVTGLEHEYESELRGKKGLSLVLKDNHGRVVGPYKAGELDSVAISGKDLISSLDIELQSYGEELLVNKIGSIVAIEPSSGEILAMISAPTYDPNLLSINRKRGEAFDALLGDSLKPFLDRAVMAKYPPGSIFKPILSLISFEEGVSHPNRYISCNGGYYYKDLHVGCHPHGPVYNVQSAIEHSCNAYYCTVLRDIVDKHSFYKPQEGLADLVAHLEDFGLGKPLGVDIPSEGTGNIPTPAYYDYLYPQKDGGWKSTTIISIGIGQGEIEMTTLQMANLAAIIANRGSYYTPHLVKGFLNDDAEIPVQYRTLKQVKINAEHFGPVIEGMERVVKSGTAQNAKIKDITICGKTGTSQNPHGKDHSVFFAFAPKENPKIAIAVYVEHGVWGARYGAPIASLMIEKYLKGAIDPSRKYLEERMLKADLISEP